MERTGSFLFWLALLLPMSVGCEREPGSRARLEEPTNLAPGPRQAALPYMAQAQQALTDKDYARCAHRFAAAARVGDEDKAAACWYRASQCAARDGDFTTSRFHIEAAASSGFADLTRLRSDPLLRPLHSGARWDLVNDAVRANQVEQALPSSEAGLCQVSKQPLRQARLAPPSPRPRAMLGNGLGR